jgi:hypothetical protein
MVKDIIVFPMTCGLLTYSIRTLLNKHTLFTGSLFIGNPKKQLIWCIKIEHCIATIEGEILVKA